MHSRVGRRAAAPGFSERNGTTDWWHHAAEYLTDAALIHAVRPSPSVDAWLHSAVLAIARRPLADWAGPPFRGFGGKDLVGSLETGHLTWGIAVALDLAGDLFDASERQEVAAALRDKGLVPCRRYLDQSGFCHNWNCVLLAGFTVAAAVLGDDEALATAAAWYPLAADHFQPDGSYGESLQYANYAAFSIMLAHEALRRRSPDTSPAIVPYARVVVWASYSLFYRKPLSGWGTTAWPRSANFGDSAALFRPSGDLLVHIAARASTSLPREAGLARWLFDTLYFPANEPGPHDLASFGFVNGFGFLSVIMLADAAAPLSPAAAGLPSLAAFSAGDTFARDAWSGLTTLAMRTPSEPRHASAHLHGDINSFILVHRNERLLADPGHSCYRNLNHDLEGASLTHNTCTFEIPASEVSAARKLTQRGGINRPIIRDARPLRGDSPVDIGGRRLITSRTGPVSVIGSEAAPLYGAPLIAFTRLWILCGAHALFVVDRIESEVPVRATWHWLLNNRDGLLDLQLVRPHALLARRGDAGLKLTHFGAGNMNGPIYAHVHDAYHPLPAQRGEGQPGSGQLMRWTEAVPATSRTVVHAIAIDSHAAIFGWNTSGDRDSVTLDGPDRRERWALSIADDGTTLRIVDSVSRQAFSTVRDAAGVWTLSAVPFPQ
jgi:hypothetical protein